MISQPEICVSSGLFEERKEPRPVAVSPSRMKIAEKLATKIRRGPEDAAPVGVVELGGGDAGDRREVAGDQRQHAGGEEGDDPRRERCEDAYPCRGVAADLGKEHDPRGYLRARCAPRPTSRLYNASGQVQRLRASPLLAIGPAAPGPALRRGALVAVPVALALIFEFAFDWPSRGAIATAALVCGFTALDAPAGPRALWQAAAAPLVGIAAALGVLSSQFAPAAVLAMGLIGRRRGLLLRRHAAARLRRLLLLGRADDLPGPLPARPRRPAGAPLRRRRRPAPGGLGGDRLARLRPRLRQRERLGLGPHQGPPAAPPGRSNPPIGRHALRYGIALALGVAIYRIAGMREHGYWIPLTILFVLRPERDETDRRLILRAVGTLVGLALATGLAVAFDGAEAADRDRPQPQRGAHLRPDHGPVRALHRRDHHLRGAAHRHPRRGPAGTPPASA